MISKDNPDFSVLRSENPVSPPVWLETRTISRAMASRPTVFSVAQLRLWRSLAFGVLVLHLVSWALLFRSPGAEVVQTDYSTTNKEIFSVDLYSYSW